MAPDWLRYACWFLLAGMTVAFFICCALNHPDPNERRLPPD
jgi:hypothetical protein